MVEGQLRGMGGWLLVFTLTMTVRPLLRSCESDDAGAELEENFGFPDREIGRILKLLNERQDEIRQDEIRQAWHQHFSR